MPTVFVNQEWGHRIRKAQQDITERVGIREPTVSQALDYIFHQRLPKPIQTR